jgi:hypothetical protein
MNALVMYDRETFSLRSQVLGVSVGGSFEGTEMEPLASTLTNWETWRELHPDTIVLDQGGRRADPYNRYYVDGSAGVLGERVSDDRLGRKEFVLGLQIDEGQKAYAFRHLNDHPAVNDELGDARLAIFFDGDSGTAAAFHRTVDGRELTFEHVDGDVDGVTLPVIDRETGSVWSGLSGDAITGELAGSRLAPANAVQVFWFAWTDFHPDAPLWEPPS